MWITQQDIWCNCLGLQLTWQSLDGVEVCPQLTETNALSGARIWGKRFVYEIMKLFGVSHVAKLYNGKMHKLRIFPFHTQDRSLTKTSVYIRSTKKEMPTNPTLRWSSSMNLFVLPSSPSHFTVRLTNSLFRFSHSAFLLWLICFAHMESLFRFVWLPRFHLPVSTSAWPSWFCPEPLPRFSTHHNNVSLRSRSRSWQFFCVFGTNTFQNGLTLELNYWKKE